MADAIPLDFAGSWRPSSAARNIIHVDPRFTRTSAVADIHAPIRAGTDIAFLGGSSTTSFQEKSTSRNTLSHIRTLPRLISEDYQDTEDLDGLFSGWEQGEGPVRK